MHENIKYLKKYHDLGFALIWLYPLSKRPIGEEWQKGERMSFDTLTKLHKPAYNVGVRLGTASKLKDSTYLCVLDCDIKSSEPHYLKELELALANMSDAIVWAPRVLSGRGGGSCHIYFRTNEPQQSFKAMRSNHKVKCFMPSVPPSDADRKSGLTEAELNEGFRMRLAWEVDVFGEGKQVVLPPSIHPDTRQPYKWEEEVLKIDQIPLVENFDLKGQKLTATTSGDTEIDYDYNLGEAYDLPVAAYKLITEGIGLEAFPSRSEALMSCINSLVKAGLKDKEVNAVLTDEANFMAEKALEKGSREHGAKWLRGQVAKARTQLSSARDFDTVEHDIEVLLSDEEAAEQEDELTPWVTKLKGKDGAYKNTAYNLELILTHGFNGRVMFHYNEFTQSVLYKSTPPWGDVSDVGKEINDVDLSRIRIWLSKYYGMECGISQIDETVTVVAHTNLFHPIKDYLNSLVWDRKPRLDNWLFDYLGAEGETEYVQAVGRKTLCGAVARVFHAGCTFQYMLILEGKQGSGKSSTCEILASKKYFSDNLGDITNKDIIEVTRGKWIIEVSELAAMSRSGANEMKDFVSKTQDTHRKAFARKAQTVPRQYIMIGTTNDEEYLKDPTGGRRFWPVRVGQTKFKELERDRDQLFAEALHVYNMGEKLFLDDQGVKSMAEAEQFDRQVVDEIESKIMKVLAEEGLLEEIDFDKFYTAFCFKHGAKDLDYALQNRCKKTFIRLGFKKTRKRVEGARAYVWVSARGKVNGYKDLSPKNIKADKELINESFKEYDTEGEEDLSEFGI